MITKRDIEGWMKVNERLYRARLLSCEHREGIRFSEAAITCNSCEQEIFLQNPNAPGYEMCIWRSKEQIDYLKKAKTL